MRRLSLGLGLLLLAARAGGTTVRLCMTVLEEYERHTLLHHIVYHRMVGIDEIFVRRARKMTRRQARACCSWVLAVSCGAHRCTSMTAKATR